jgi:phosphotransferase system HPr (HPr) family protein
MSASSPLPSERTVSLPEDVDLHARPARDVVVAAASFASRITLAVDGREADARSILQVMGLGARRGTAIAIRASGDDADEAAQAVATVLAALR